MVASDILTNACLLRRTHTCSGAAVGEKWLSQSGAYAISYVVAVFPTLPIVRSAQLSPVWRFLMSCPVGCQPTCWPAGLPLLCLLRFSHCHRRCYPALRCTACCRVWLGWARGYQRVGVGANGGSPNRWPQRKLQRSSSSMKRRHRAPRTRARTQRHTPTDLLPCQSRRQAASTLSGPTTTTPTSKIRTGAAPGSCR